jgi:predicted ester cyclase
MFGFSKIFAPISFVVIAALMFAAMLTNHAAAQQDNKAEVAAMFDAYNAAIRSGDTTILETFLSPEYKDLDASEGIKGVDYLKSILATNRSAAPDAQYEVKAVVAEGDIVAVYNVFSGTNTGRFGDIGPSNKKFAIKSIAIFTFKDGKVVEHVSATDTTSFYQQLGLTLQLSVAAP